MNTTTGQSTSHITWTNSPIYPSETLYEITPRQYSLRLLKTWNSVLGENEYRLTLSNTDGVYTGRELAELLFDFCEVAGCLDEDEDEEDVEDEPEDDEETDEEDDTPPPSRASEQADGVTTSETKACLCNLCNRELNKC